MSKSGAREPAPGELAQLIETEARLEGDLAQVRRQAEVLLAGARAGAQERERAIGSQVEAAVERLRAETERALAQRRAAIQADAQREIARYRHALARASELAHRVVSLLLHGEKAGA